MDRWMDIVQTDRKAQNGPTFDRFVAEMCVHVKVGMWVLCVLDESEGQTDGQMDGHCAN